MVTIGIVDTAPTDFHDIAFPPYCKGVEGCGASYRVLNWTTNEKDFDEYIASCDGFIFTGGDDIDPVHYGEVKLPECGDITPDRDAFELNFFPRVLKSKKPILAICRGFQVLNVVLGGTLWQDIPSQVSNTYDHQPDPLEMIAVRTHNVVFVQNTKLRSILKTNKAKMNSMHHQGVKTLGNGLLLSAVSTDGIPEAFEMPDHKFVIGVQWHPEWLFPQDDSHALFSALIKASEEFKNEM